MFFGASAICNINRLAIVLAVIFKNKGVVMKSYYYLLGIGAVTAILAGCGSGGGSSSSPTPSPTPSPTTTCNAGTANATNTSLLQDYLFAYQPLFQYDTNDSAGGAKTYGCYNTGGTYAVSSINITDDYNYSWTYTLNNCVSTTRSKSGYTPSTPWALTGSYTMAVTGNKDSSVLTITPTSNIQILFPATLASSGWTLLAGGSVAYPTPVSGSNALNVKYTNWAMQTASQTLTGNYTINNTMINSSSFSQSIAAGASLSSNGGWSLNFTTSTPLNRTGNVWPNTINSGVLSANGSNNSTATSTYSSQSSATSYQIQACNSSGNGYDVLGGTFLMY